MRGRTAHVWIEGDYHGTTGIEGVVEMAPLDVPMPGRSPFPDVKHGEWDVLGDALRGLPDTAARVAALRAAAGVSLHRCAWCGATSAGPPEIGQDGAHAAPDGTRCRGPVDAEIVA